jgi:hypothetical protein
MQPWRKEPRREGAITSEERDDIQRDLRENVRAGDREANCHVFRQDAENEGLDIVEGSAPSETEKDIAHGVRAGNVGAPANLGSFAPQNGKKDDDEKIGSTGTLRREQWGRLERSHSRKNRATGI